MPKEFLTFELSRSSGGTPWGMRIGGGVDRGKVLVLEKVRKNFFVCCKSACNTFAFAVSLTIERISMGKLL
jgi:hypothetical protein